MPVTTGRLRTDHASKYLGQLCKHFAHKVEVSFDAHQGWADLPPGRVNFTATPTELVAACTYQDEQGQQLAREIIDSHLKTFAFREEVSTMTWDGEA